MQCFRCGQFLPGDGFCPVCGGALPLGEDYCTRCGTALLCEQCRGAPGEIASAATPGATDTALQPADGLQYEYQTITIPLKVYRRDDESLPSYYARIHQYLVEQTQPAALDGWETVDTLDYSFLDRQGLAQHNLLDFCTNRSAHSITLRLRRLTAGPPDHAEM